MMSMRKIYRPTSPVEEHDTVRSIGALLDSPGSRAATLLTQAKCLDVYLRAVTEWARANTCPLPHAVMLRDGVLTVFMSSATHATTMRFQANDLLLFVQRRFTIELQRVNVKVVPP